jgi:hypothetical protein
MPSTFKSLALFAGPHRFAVAKQGHLVLSDFALGGFGPNSYPLGLVELDVIVTGRLVASSESALRALRDAMTNELLDPPTPGALIDSHGHMWDDMSFHSYQEGDRTHRGREHSISYEARFRRFNTLAFTPPTP